MNKEQTKQAIAVMQAYVDGEQIQIYCGMSNKWIDTPFPLWAWTSVQYRIKPKTAMYRRYYTKAGHIGVCNYGETLQPPQYYEAFAGFSHWIDTDWQELEI